MIHVHFIGRVGKNAKVITGTHGTFMTVDLAVDDFAHGQKTTSWIRVRSKGTNHIKLCEYLTKGKLLLVEGTLNEPMIWADKENKNHVQIAVTAETMNFINVGKKKEDTQGVESVSQEKEENMPFPAPDDTSENIPY